VLLHKRGPIHLITVGFERLLVAAHCLLVDCPGACPPAVSSASRAPRLAHHFEEPLFHAVPQLQRRTSEFSPVHALLAQHCMKHGIGSTCARGAAHTPCSSGPIEPSLGAAIGVRLPASSRTL